MAAPPAFPQLADKLAADLGLAYFGKSPVRWAFTVEFNNAYAASLAGNTSDAIAMSAAARDAMLHQLTVMHVQVRAHARAVHAGMHVHGMPA